MSPVDLPIDTQVAWKLSPNHC